MLPFRSWTCALCLLLFLSVQAFSQKTVSPADDPRLKAWASAFLAKDYRGVLSSVEADLQSGHAHPWAPDVWTMTHHALGDLDSAWHGASASLQPALGSEPEIYLWYDQDKYSQMLSKYPPEKTREMKDVWALKMLDYAAWQQVRHEERFAYQLQIARLEPESFLGADLLVQPGNESVRQQTLELASHGELAGTALGKFLLASFKYRPSNDREELAAVNVFLDSHPGDPWALRYKAEKLDNLNLEEKAAPFALASIKSYPFWCDLALYGKILVFSAQSAEAKKSVAEISAIKHADRPDAAAAAEVARSFIDASRRGEARRILDAALAKFPTDPELVEAMVDLESNSGRHDQAAVWAKKLVEISSKLGAREKLVKELDEPGHYSEAIAAYKKYRPAVVEEDLDLSIWGADAYGQLEDHEDALQIFSDAAKNEPGAQGLLIDIAQQLGWLGRYDEAWEKLQQAYSIYPPNNWRINQTTWLWQQAKQPERISASFDWLLQKYPWDEDIWKKKAESLSSDKERIAMWRDAASRNPDRAFPYEEMLYLYDHANDWEGLQGVLALESEAVKRGPLSDQLQLQEDHAWVLQQRIDAQQVSTGELQEALQQLEEFRSADGNPIAYHRYRAAVLNALGRRREAAKDTVAYAQLVGGCDASNNIFNLYSDSDLPTARKFEVLRECVDRDPYNGEYLSMIAEKHAQWNGSPIVALHYIDLIKERAPNTYSDRSSGHSPQSLEATAWGELGDHVRDFEFSYEHAEFISESDRYVHWYDSARRKAQEPNSTASKCGAGDQKIALVCDEYTYKITHPDGQIEYRRDNPLSGKRELYQIGAAWIRAEYDAIGNNLQRISSSGGQDIKLNYDDHDRISTLTTSDGQEVAFTYNEIDKPVTISVKSLGTITVTYTAEGEIEKVDSTAGRQIALKITSAFQTLLDLVQPFQSSGTNDLPDLPLKDSKRDSLEAAANNPACEEAKLPVVLSACAQHRLELAQYLVAHAAEKMAYQSKARELIEEIYDQAARGKVGAVAPQAVDAIGAWYKLMLKSRRDGLPGDDWSLWNEMRTWLSAQSGKPALAAKANAILRASDSSPLTLLKTAQWSPKSYVSSPGFWRRFRNDEILPPEARQAQQNAILVRRNHDVVIGTSRGLAVFSQGHWVWYGFDDMRGKFSPNLGFDKLGGTSEILSLAELQDGTLIVGTGDGLIVVSGDVGGAARVWKESEGLRSRRVEHVAALGFAALIGGSKGLMSLDGDKLTPVAGFDEPVTFLRAVSEDGNGSAMVLTGTGSGVFGLSGAGKIQIDSVPSRDALWSREMERVFLLRDDGLYSAQWDGMRPPKPPISITGQQDIVKSQKIYGLADIPLDDATGVGVLTDQGISVFRDEHFEFVKPPNQDRSAGVQAFDTRDLRSYMLTSDGVYALERGQAMGDTSGRVYDLLTDNELGMTFVARGDRLDAVDHKNVAAGAARFASVGATHLAQDAEGRLIANDGTEIVRFQRGESTPQELFSAGDQTVNNQYRAGDVTSILVASDGTIWVTAGASLFRWREGMGNKAEEYSVFKDPDAFPSRSEMLSCVVETFDHHIWVIASNEGHLTWNGMSLTGGVVEWTGKDFRRIAESDHAPSGWFVTGYTQVNDDMAILGSTSGFVRYNGNSYQTYRGLKDTSYDLLLKHTPLLWLGTRGAKLGDDTWLFGTAGGIVGYRQGVWFYPDRINWMLPEDYRFSGKYGVRTVHAVATDKSGHIFAGTDRGLLIYESGGGDSTSFLVSNNLPDLALGFVEKTKFQHETEILLKGLETQQPNSPVVGKLREVRAVEHSIADLETRLEDITAPQLRSALPSSSNDRSANEKAPEPANAGDQVRKELEAKRAARLHLLLEIEKENPGIHKILDFQPLDLVGLSQKLGDAAAFVQYLPGESQLYIHVVTRAGIEIRTVDKVTAAELNKRAAHAALLLGPKRSQMPSDAIELVTSQLTRDDELLWLYDTLLRPIENDLVGKKTIYLVLPVGPLRLLPFEALLRSKDPKPEYAVERYSFGYLPTLYLYQLASSHVPSHSTADLILADPDGSLVGARTEAAEVHKLVGSATEEIGKDATYGKLEQFASQAKVLHLATHGLMDYRDPADSYLLLADRRMTPVDIMLLSLHDTDLAVISACESGIGSDGMEYATLADAFAHAGVPSTVASLWRVPDEATHELMREFYTHLMNNEDAITSLTAAKREMLSSNNHALHAPNAWAGFVVFGKP